MAAQHTYLRYECADAFSLTTSASSSTAPPTTSTLAFLSRSPTSPLLSTAASQLVGFNLRTLGPCLKLGHRDDPSGGVGTGRALNGDEATCLDVCHRSSASSAAAADGNDYDDDLAGGGGGVKVAAGWSDGTVRVFDLSDSEVAAASSTTSSSTSHSNLGLIHSLLHSDDAYGGSEDFVSREPLVLNGHGSSPVRCVVFDKARGKLGGIAGASGGATRLASGGSDGTVILWDIVAETGLFRLLGHRGPITDVGFVRAPSSTAAAGTAAAGGAFDGLITSSADGLVKVWDLDGQCCSQTVANHSGEVSCSATVRLAGDRDGDDGGGGGDESDEGGGAERWRLLTGCADGAVRVYSVASPGRRIGAPATAGGEGGGDAADAAAAAAAASADDENADDNDDDHVRDDDAVHYIGTIPSPPNVATSNSKVASIHFHPSQPYAGVCRANSKDVAVYLIRSAEESKRKMVRRLRRRREKEGQRKGRDEAGGGATNNRKAGRKRGILDDDDESADDDMEEQQQQRQGGAAAVDRGNIDPASLIASDEFEYVTTIRASHKVKGFVFAPYSERGGGIRVLCALATNALEVHSVKRVRQKQKKGSESQATVYAATRLSTLDMYGHPTGIRSISLSSDDDLACTVSKSVAKVWNVANRSCLRSLPLSSSSAAERGAAGRGAKKASAAAAASYYGLCSAFLPGNTHVVIGTREGHLLILDVASGDIVHTEENAHDGAIWSLDLRRPDPDRDGGGGGAIAIVTGSADKLVKFWDVERQEGEEGNDDDEAVGSGSHQPMVVHTRSLQMSDDVVAVRYSHSSSANDDPAKRLVFVSALDCTVKVFFDDTLKFFLSLYGHKLPALAVDASDDGAILATGGADKTVKIWGLDFGDTHRTLHGHTDSVTDLRFVRRTHYFFTTSKDGNVRYWDGDRFEQILLLNGHAAEVSCLVVGRTGAFVLTGGMDRQVRVWERTRDIVFLEEERERELEAMFDEVDGSKGADMGTANLLQRRRRGDEEDGGDDDDDDDEAAGDGQPQSEAAVRRSVLSVSSGDRIMEAIERADQETKDVATFNKSQKGSRGEKRRTPNPLLLGMEPPQYVLWVLRSVKSAELEQSLLVLPLSHMERLLHYLIVLLRSGRGVEICSRVAIFLVKTHQTQIIATRSLATPLRELRRLVKLRLAEIRDTVGFNQAALRAIAKAANDRKNSYFVPDGKETDIWADLGLGSDVAAALVSKGSNKGKLARK